MNNKFKWKKVENRSLPNLNVLEVDGKDVGFIFRFKDTPSTKDMWKLFVGIGIDAKYLGSLSSKTDAKNELCAYLKLTV